MCAYFFSVLILPNKAWHKDIKLVTNIVYSCVNPCNFNLHDTKAEVSVLMSINVRSASTPDLQFCCHDSCCRQRLRKQRRMLNNDENDEMLLKGKFSHWKKKKWWRGWFWLGDPLLAVNLHSNLYSPPLYSVGNDWFSFPLENHVISQKYSPPRAKDDECSPITSYFFTNFAYQNSFLQFLIVCFVLLATQARYRTPKPRY